VPSLQDVPATDEGSGCLLISTLIIEHGDLIYTGSNFEPANIVANEGSALSINVRQLTAVLICT
jgi:hypothetical protein